MWNVLGIDPTTDIKAIKSAYAKLAKKYNPEEHPEEFKKLFDAYKNACAFARAANKADRPQENTDNGRTDLSLEDALKGGNEDISTDEKGEALDFSSVGNSSDTEEASTNDEVFFDFSSLDPDMLNATEEERAERLQKFYLENIRMLVKKRSSANNRKLWYELLSQEDFGSIANDEAFRAEAFMLLCHTTYTREIAELIAYYFGNGASVRCINSISNEWQVDLLGIKSSERRNRAAGRDNPKISTWVAALLVFMAIIIFIFLPMAEYFSTRNYIDTYTYSNRNDYSTKELPTFSEVDDIGKYLTDSFGDIVDETQFDIDTLYPMCVGRWVNNNTHIDIKENYTYELYENGQKLSEGKLEARAAEKGTEVYMTVYSEDTEYDLSTADAVLVSTGVSRLTFIKPDGTSIKMYRVKNYTESNSSPEEKEATASETSAVKASAVSESFALDDYDVTVTFYEDKSDYFDITMVNTGDVPRLDSPKALYANRFFEKCSKVIICYPSGMSEEVNINNGIPDFENSGIFFPVLWEDTEKYKADSISSLRRVDPEESVSVRCVLGTEE